jgi:hypothetical protein
MELIAAPQLTSSKSRNGSMSHTKNQCDGATSLTIRQPITCKFTLMVCELWLASKLGTICDSDLAAFIGTPCDTFSLVLSQS